MGHDGMGAPPGPEGLIPQDEAFSSGPLLTHYLQHLLWWFREGVEPVMAVDGHAGRASVGTKTPWLQGHIGERHSGRRCHGFAGPALPFAL